VSALPSRRLHPELPIFRVEDKSRAIFYTPGHVAVADFVVGARIEALLGGDEAGAFDTDSAAIVRRLEEHAHRAVAAWRELARGAFTPECLTVYLSNRCDLGCVYCYAAEESGARRRAGNGTPLSPLLDRDTVATAARLVADSCAVRDRRFRLVMHGGGEPTLHWTRLQQTVEDTRRIAAEAGIGWWGYIATHGVIEPERASWLADNFDLIGLSCDGPPDIHASQRQRLDGRETVAPVERTARILRERGARFIVRATITPNTVRRQAEIVVDLNQRMGADSLAFEPVYRAHRSDDVFRAGDAEEFSRHFLAAQEVADALGCELRTTVVRLDEIHGPYCDVARNVLRLTPDGSATACFLSTDGRHDDFAPLVVGRPESGAFVLDEERISRLRERVTRIPSRCTGCVNVYHCARECPQTCAAVDDDAFATEDFRCRSAQILSHSWIVDAVSGGPRATAPGAEVEEFARLVRGIGHTRRPERLARIWRTASAAFAIDGRGPPLAPWIARGFQEHGAAAWDRVRSAVATGRGRPIAVYAHLPFCDRRCSFCDCHAFLLPMAASDIEKAYVRALVAECECWSALDDLSDRSVTTVHFGGGTPTYLSPALFEEIILAMRRRFGTTPETEWAAETTTSQLDAARRTQLRALGFSRLHVGIQSLDARLRRLLGRREPPGVALDALGAAIEDGFVLSVDMLVGLPEQTVESLLVEVARLVELGVHGFSFYPLNVTHKNRRFAREYGIDHRSALPDFLMLAAVEELLRGDGYGKNHFAHFARPQDRNVYYRHAARGEDLLALGASADGIFGDYRYRHPGHAEYVRGTTTRAPALQGGMTEDRRTSEVRPVAAALMASSIERAVCERIGRAEVFDNWSEAGLIESNNGASTHGLTAAGSWNIARMLEELS